MASLCRILAQTSRIRIIVHTKQMTDFQRIVNSRCRYMSCSRRISRGELEFKQTERETFVFYLYWLTCVWLRVCVCVCSDSSLYNEREVSTWNEVIKAVSSDWPHRYSRRVQQTCVQSHAGNYLSSPLLSSPISYSCVWYLLESPSFSHSGALLLSSFLSPSQLSFLPPPCPLSALNVLILCCSLIYFHLSQRAAGLQFLFGHGYSSWF